MRVVVIGAGYVGLVSGACFAELGHEVICVDRDARKISALLAGQMPIFEPGLAEMVERNRVEGRLAFALDAGPHLRDSDAVFIAVGTPPDEQSGAADLTALKAVALELAAKAPRQLCVVIKSTVPPGTGDAVEQILRESRPDLELTVIANPEFLREGNAISDFLEPDRIVCGVETAHASAVMTELYRPLTSKGSPLHFARRRAAEMIKHASNAFLAIKISFINEVADLCEVVGADIDDVATGVGLDRRIGADFLRAGPGYGGSCFPKDAAALLSLAADHDVRLRVVESATLSNQARQQAMVARIVHRLGGDLQGKIVAMLGLAFKANTDDVRESPAINIAQALLAMGATVRVFDPEAMDSARTDLAGAIFAEDAYTCAEGADCIALLTEWAQFRLLDPLALRRVVRAPLLIDLRNWLDSAAFERAGFRVDGVGKGQPVLGEAGPNIVELFAPRAREAEIRTVRDGVFSS